MADFTVPRITEKRYLPIPPQLFTADGTNTGTITILNTYSFKVGQLVILKSNTQSGLKVKIQKVISETQLIVINIDEAVTTKNKLDISMFLLADTATVELLEDKRPVIDLNEIQRQVYEEEPTVALRSHSVDWLGRPYDKSNPLPVQLSNGSIDIGTVNAELEVALSHRDNTPDPGDVADSVRIGDGTDELAINSDGSINVVFTPDNSLVKKSIYAEISAINSATPTTILSYTVPIGIPTATINTVDVSGTNIATYQVEVNSATVDKKRTYHGGSLNSVFDFNDSISLITGDIVRISVEHARPFSGDFNARLVVVEKN
jgi:hypothetical protein